MLSSRDEKKESTRSRLLGALDRLLKGNPTSPKLIKRNILGKLKINPHTVEIESGLAIGALRHYPDVTLKINEELSKLIAGNESSSISPIDNCFILKREETNKLKAKLKDKTRLSTEYRKEVLSLNAAMAKQLSSHHNMVIALLKDIPNESIKSGLIESINRSK